MERYRWEGKCKGCHKIFYSDRQNRRFHSDDCMKDYYDRKYGSTEKKEAK